MKPMLAQKLPGYAMVDTLISSTAWILQQKIDGERLLIQIRESEATGFNRNGEITNVPTCIAADFDKPAFTGEWIFDGEIIGDTYYIFDCVKARNIINHSNAFMHRIDFLKNLYDRWRPVNCRIVATAYSTVEKKALLQTAIVGGSEGVVFKYGGSKYQEGKRPKEILKYKFVETADVFVKKLNREGKRQAITIGLFHNGEEIEVGGCKIPEEAIGILNVDDVIEVEYLYANQPSNKLYQPVWLKIRDDKKKEECTTGQLKYTNKIPIDKF